MKARSVLVSVVVFTLVVMLSSCMATRDMVRTLEVSGTGEVQLTPDIASFSIQVSELGKTTRDAQNLANVKMAEILKVLSSHGVEAKDIATAALNLRPSYLWIENKQVLEGQVASQTLSVTLRDLSLLGQVIDELGEVSGIYLNSVQLDKADKSEALLEARKKAVAHALSKAEVYAGSSNMSVGKPITLSESSVASNPYAVREKAMMASGAYDMATEIPSGSMTVTSTISMVLEMY